MTARCRSAGFWPGGNGIDYPAFYVLRLSGAERLSDRVREAGGRVLA